MAEIQFEVMTDLAVMNMHGDYSVEDYKNLLKGHNRISGRTVKNARNRRDLGDGRIVA